MKADTGAGLDSLDDMRDEVADVGGGGVADVFDPVGVLGADHGPTDAMAFETGLLDVNGRRDTVAGAENAAGGRAGERLFFLALLKMAARFVADGGRVAGLAEDKAGTNDKRARLAVGKGLEVALAVGKMEGLRRAGFAGTIGQDEVDRVKEGFGVPGITRSKAGVHEDSPAHGTGDSDEKFKPRKTFRRRRLGQPGEENTGLRHKEIPLPPDILEGVAQEEDKSGKARIVDEDIRAPTDHPYRQPGGSRPSKQSGNLIDSGFREILRRPTDSPCGEGGQGDSGTNIDWHNRWHGLKMQATTGLLENENRSSLLSKRRLCGKLGK